jgi:molybdopterin-containing oxidoreductase family iron-sulfur binding subunit
MPHTTPSEPLVFQRDASGALNRRQAMALMAASLALANGACTKLPRERIHPWVQMPEARGGGLPLYYASAFVRDGYAHGVLVGTQQGRPIKIEGNPAHPSSLGATDVFMQASVLQLWDPDRSTAVRERLGEPHDDAQAPVMAASSWNAFDTAWRARAPALSARGGEGLCVLTGPLTSPTMRAQLQALLTRFPRARWHQHAPLRDRAAAEGALSAHGRPLQAVLHLDRARCIVALAADPFSDGPGAVRHAVDWAARRAATRSAPATAPRLLAAEVSPGLFGARADERIALAPARIDALLWRVAGQLLDDAAPAAPSGDDAAFESRLVAALRAAGPASLIVPGPSLSPASHALVHVLHERLGARGNTLDLIDPPDLAPEAGTLAELVQAMHAGAVDTLFMLDVNPLYDAPPQLEVASALAQVRFSVHQGLCDDETARACHWHLPQTHVYESWGDALAHDGSAALIQPAIAPLYDTRCDSELVAGLISDGKPSAHDLVRRQWRARAGADAEGFWRDSLQRGVIAGTAAPALQLRSATRPAAAPQTAIPAGTIAAVFVADASVHDGRFANSGWLQELPRPFSKLTWDNALTLGPDTARSLGVDTGDIVRATIDGRHVDAPVWVLAEHAEGAATLPLGYGRTRAGRVGTRIGFDAYRLWPQQSGRVDIALQRTGRHRDFAVTQHTIDQAGRELARTLAPGERIRDNGFEHASLYPPKAPQEHAWAMAIDLDTCIGCNACTIACQAENNIPVVGREEVTRGREMHWIRVDRYRAPEVAGSIFQPVPCMHCENAPCELVCPVGATVHDSDGLNVQVYNRCIGTRFCSNNCPYKVRRFNFLQYTDNETETLKAQRNPDVTVRRRGVMEKCTYCLQRIARARQHEQRTGEAIADGDVVTACQSACPTRAIRFGDLNDPASVVAQARRSPRQYALLGELNTRPRTTYLARVRAAKREDQG